MKKRCVERTFVDGQISVLAGVSRRNRSPRPQVPVAQTACPTRSPHPGGATHEAAGEKPARHVVGDETTSAGRRTAPRRAHGGRYVQRPGEPRDGERGDAFRKERARRAYVP